MRAAPLKSTNHALSGAVRPIPLNLTTDALSTARGVCRAIQRTNPAASRRTDQDTPVARQARIGAQRRAHGGSDTSTDRAPTLASRPHPDRSPWVTSRGPRCAGTTRHGATTGTEHGRGSDTPMRPLRQRGATGHSRGLATLRRCGAHRDTNHAPSTDPTINAHPADVSHAGANTRNGATDATMRRASGLVLSTASPLC